MTWYAGHVYAAPKLDVIRWLKESPLMASHLYLVDSLDGFDWEADINFIEKFRHGLPPGGLLVAREICNPENKDEAEWHRDFISWHDIQGQGSAPIIRPPHLPVSAMDNLYPEGLFTIHDKDPFPAVGFLRFLKELSQTAGAPVCFYHHGSGAEQAVQQEFAWVFGDGEDCVYVAHVDKGGDVVRYTASDSSVVAKDPRDGTLLTFTLRHFGLALPSHYFAPHTRRFDWDRYRLAGDTIKA